MYSPGFYMLIGTLIYCFPDVSGWIIGVYLFLIVWRLSA